MATMTENERFTREVYPVCERYAMQLFRGDEDKTSVALVLCWYYWSQREEDYPASHWSRIAVRHVFAGRDLPRIGATRSKDALRHATQGAGMDEVTCPRPGPAELIEERERVELLYASLSERERIIAEMLASGVQAARVAEAVGISQGRVTQIRQALMDRLTELE